MAVAPTGEDMVRTENSGPAKKKAKVDLFDLDGTLRGLGRRLLEGDGLPSGWKESPLREGDRISREEHAFLWALLVGHFVRHEDVAGRPEVVQFCPNKTGPCKSAGLAQALLRGCDALRDRKQLKHVQALREVISEAQWTFKKLCEEIGEYLTACQLLHKTEWKGIPPRLQQRDSKVRIHVHDDVCLLPARLGRFARRMQRGLAIVDAVALVPQYASSEVAANRPGRKRRPLLLAAMQADLIHEGWSLDDAAQIVDDKIGGAPDVIRDRIRKRITSILKAYRGDPAKIESPPRAAEPPKARKTAANLKRSPRRAAKAGGKKPGAAPPAQPIPQRITSRPVT